MLIPLDGASPQPLYRQLRDGIARAIQEGRHPDEDLLPSSRALAMELGISRNTVNAAYQDLVAEGFLETIPRRGHRVSPELRAQLRLGNASPRSDHSIEWEDRLEPFQEDVGEITKPSDWDRYPYPFVVGQPDVAAFPAAAWIRAQRAALDGPSRGSSLHDLIDRDDPLLVEMIVSRILPLRGITAAPEQVLITLGSQHGIYMLAGALTGPGSVVGVEEPGYPDARQIFRRQGARLAPLPVDGNGLVLEDRELAGLDAVFVTPSHQYPTNVTMSIGRRHQLLAQGAAHDVMVIEDDYDSEFRYQGTPTPALKALDPGGRVLYLGSFSKFLAPGLRLGYLVADPPLVEHLRERRRYAVRHPSGLLQRTVALMIEQGDYLRSLRRSRKLMKAKWEQAVTSARHHLGFVAEPTGGLSLWVEGDRRRHAGRLAAAALARGVVIEPGTPCFLTRPAPSHYFRIGFSGIPLERIDQGLSLLGQVVAGD